MRRIAQGVAVVLVLAAGVPLRAGGPISAAGSAGARGYRLRGYQWDQVLRQRWAVYQDGAHPERPLVSELDPERGAAAGPVVAGAGPAALLSVPIQPVKMAEMVVHSGDAVTLWREEANVRMQLAAVAEGNAAVGERIQLRVTGAGVYGNTGWRATGFVRGPGSVEME